MTDQLNVSDVWTVVPTIRPKSLELFLQKWGREFGDRLIIVEDASEKSDTVASVAKGRGIHISRQEAVDLFGEENTWMVSRKSDAVRCLGILLAHRSGAKATLTLDDDCYPPFESMPAGSWMQDLVDRLNGVRHDAWTSTIDNEAPRGMPYGSTLGDNAPVYVNHGLWLNVPDLDGATQLQRMRQKNCIATIGYPTQIIEPGKFFPMCSMNLAWRREMTPAMFFMLMGENWPFDRFGDIWCGLFAKKVADHLGYRVRSGDPYVHHARASDPFVNLVKEAGGMPVHEILWRRVYEAPIDVTAKSVTDAYRSLVESVDFTGLPEPDYWPKLKQAMLEWTMLVNNILVLACGNTQFDYKNLVAQVYRRCNPD